MSIFIYTSGGNYGRLLNVNRGFYYELIVSSSSVELYIDDKLEYVKNEALEVWENILKSGIKIINIAQAGKDLSKFKSILST